MMKGSPGSKRFHKQQPGLMDPRVGEGGEQLKTETLLF
jgi:hypothetical protein